MLEESRSEREVSDQESLTCSHQAGWVSLNKLLKQNLLLVVGACHCTAPVHGYMHGIGVQSVKHSGVCRFSSTVCAAQMRLCVVCGAVHQDFGVDAAGESLLGVDQGVCCRMWRVLV